MKSVTIWRELSWTTGKAERIAPIIWVCTPSRWKLVRQVPDIFQYAIRQPASGYRGALEGRGRDDIAVFFLFVLLVPWMKAKVTGTSGRLYEPWRRNPPLKYSSARLIDLDPLKSFPDSTTIYFYWLCDITGKVSKLPWIEVGKYLKSWKWASSKSLGLGKLDTTSFFAGTTP